VDTVTECFAMDDFERVGDCPECYSPVVQIAMWPWPFRTCECACWAKLRTRVIGLPPMGLA
jgi:hypothetical protein